jgi:hypothetical protein
MSKNKTKIKSRRTRSKRFRKSRRSRNTKKSFRYRAANDELSTNPMDTSPPIPGPSTDPSDVGLSTFSFPPTAGSSTDPFSTYDVMKSLPTTGKRAREEEKAPEKNPDIHDASLKWKHALFVLNQEKRRKPRISSPLAVPPHPGPSDSRAEDG